MEKEKEFDSKRNLRSKNMFEKFLAFLEQLSIVNLFKKYKEIPQDPELLYLQAETDKLIEKKDWSNLLILIENGYQLSKSQNKTIDDMFEEILFERHAFKKEGFELFSTLYNGDFPFTENIKERSILALLKEFNVFYFLSKGALKKEVEDFSLVIQQDWSYRDLKKYEPMLVEIYSLVKKNPEKLLKIWLNFIENNAYAFKGASTPANIYNNDLAYRMYDILLKDYVLTLPDHKMSYVEHALCKYVKVLEGSRFSVKDSVKDFKSILKELEKKNPIHENHMASLISKTQNVFANKPIAKEINPEVMAPVLSNYKRQDLTIEIQMLLENIKNNYAIITKNKEALSIEQLFNCENILNNKLPEVMNNLCSFSKEERMSIKNYEGKSPNDLCENTLANMASHFQELVDSIKQDKLSKLSVANKYSKNLKMK